MKVATTQIAVIGLFAMGFSAACAESYRKSGGDEPGEMVPGEAVDAGSSPSPFPDASVPPNPVDAGSSQPPTGNICEFPYLCAESIDECNDFWEGEVVPNASCDPGDGVVCCNPFTSEGESGQNDGGMAPEPPTGDPLTREDFCLLIIECVMPEGSTVGDCNSVYDDNYCNNWNNYLTCMNSCTSIDCAADEFGTEFVVCEYDCFDDYCG